jgi:hypothetical protein
VSPRERVEAALNHREPDRTPAFEYVLLSPLADTLLGRPYSCNSANWDALVRGKGWEGAIRQQAIDKLDLAVRLGHDMMYVGPNRLPDRPSPKSSPPQPEPPKDPVEAMKARNERAPQAAPPADEAFIIYSFLKEEMRRRDVDLPILAPAYAHGVWTDVELMQTMILDPEVAHRHFSLATGRSLALIDRYLALGIDQIGIGGDFAGTRLIISPAAYREFIVPEVRRLSERIHEANAYAVNASDGNLWPVLEDFLVACQVDGYLEIDAFAGMDMKRLKAAYGDRITLYGNLDCGNMLSFGSADDVRRHTIQCLEDGQGNGGHILCASNAITASVPLGNYLAMLNAYRDFFRLPKFATGR